MWQLIKIGHEALDTRIDQLLGHPVAFAPCVHQTGDMVQRSAVACAKKRRPHRFSIGADAEEQFKQTEQHILLARHGDVRTDRVCRVSTEDLIWLVDGFGAAGNDQRSVIRIDPLSIADQLHARLGVQAHARNHEHVGDSSVEPHPRRTKISVPLLKDDSGLLESGVDHGRADGPDACGRHTCVGEDKRQHPCAMVERTGDHHRQVVLRCKLPQALAQTDQLARPERFVTASATRKFHIDPLRNDTRDSVSALLPIC